MKFRKLSGTDLNISQICLGTMTWGQQNSQEDGFAQMDYSLDKGINFFDTAELYATPPMDHSYGKTESIIGNWFAKTKKRDSVSLAFFGDGAANQGGLYEAMNISSVWNLPVIFLCENNQYALSTPASSVTAGEIYRRSEGFGMKGVRVEDGQDVLKVYEAVKGAVNRARAGDGPSLVEVVTYRFNEHSEGLRLGVDYRNQDEKLHWQSRDPIVIFSSWLEDRGILDRAGLEKIDEEIRTEVEDAATFAENSAEPDPETAFQNLYTEPLEILR